MKPKFTPGPWKIRHSGSVGTDRELIAIVYPVSPEGEEYEDLPEMVANCHLIAAAPTMLAEMKTIFGAWKNYLREQTPQPMREQWSILMGRLEYEIAKAEGIES
jgi:hypothetical protein